MRLRMVWRVEDTFGCRFDDLFEPIPQIEEITYVRRFHRSPKDWPWLKHKLGLWPWQPVLVEKQVADLCSRGGDIAPLMGARGAYVRTWSRFYEAGEAHDPAEFFRPVAVLRERIDAVTQGFGRTIGVHIRRGDHQPARLYSPTEMFLERVRAELDAAPGTTIFLATDDRQVETEFITAFGRAVIVRPKTSLNRAEIAAQRDAVVDLFCLAATQKVIGSFASSFSRTAAELGRIPRETLSLHHGEALTW